MGKWSSQGADRQDVVSRPWAHLLSPPLEPESYNWPLEPPPAQVLPQLCWDLTPPSISAQKPQRKALKTRGMLTQQEIRNIHVSTLPKGLEPPQHPKALMGLCSFRL